MGSYSGADKGECPDWIVPRSGGLWDTRLGTTLAIVDQHRIDDGLVLEYSVPDL